MTDATVGSGRDSSKEDNFQKIFDEARSVLQDFRSAATSLRISSDGTCPIFFRDCVIHAALPWADVDTLQRRLLVQRAPEDEVFIGQILDLIPALPDQILIDVGTYTGALGFTLRAFMEPKETHLFEPQAVMQESLHAATALNARNGNPIFLHRDILDEDGQQMEMGANTPARLSQTRYLRREGGKLAARSLDSFGFGPVGLINLDISNDKVPILRGALTTIRRDRPVICMDLTSRDLEDIRALLAPENYREVRAGRNSMILLPD